MATGWTGMGRRGSRAARARGWGGLVGCGRRVWFGLWLAQWLGALVAAESGPVSENRVKALFVVNMIKYVEWGRADESRTNGPVIVGVAGKSGVAEEIERALAGRPAAVGRPIVLKSLNEEQDADQCHVVYLPGGDSRRLAGYLERLREAPTLTIGDSERFTQLGGMIALLRKDDRVRPRVNLTAAERAGLKVSSKLLSVSDVIREEGGRAGP